MRQILASIIIALSALACATTSDEPEPPTCECQEEAALAVEACGADLVCIRNTAAPECVTPDLVEIVGECGADCEIADFAPLCA